MTQRREVLPTAKELATDYTDLHGIKKLFAYGEN
jgi:hypothetical protein